MRDAAEKDADVIEFHVFIEVRKENELHGRDRRCEMMGEVGVRQLMRDDRWEEVWMEQRYQDVMSSYQVEISSSKRINDGPE